MGYRDLTLEALIAVVLLAGFLLAVYLRPDVGLSFFGGRVIEADIGSVIRFDGWGVIVKGASVSRHLRPTSCCSLIVYRAGGDSMIVVVELEVAGFDGEVVMLDEFKLLTDSGKSYERIYPYMLTPVPATNLSNGIVEEAIEYKELPVVFAIPSGERIRGHVLFEISSGERPVRLIFRANETIIVSVDLGSYSGEI